MQAWGLDVSQSGYWVSGSSEQPQFGQKAGSEETESPFCAVSPGFLRALRFT